MAETHDVRVMKKRLNTLEDANKEIKKKLDARQDCNQAIVKILKEIVDNNSSLRFCQILAMFDLDRDRFNEESIDTLEAIRTKLAEL